MINKLTLLLMALLLSSCTSRDYYKSFQPDKSSCEKSPTSQREECMNNIEKQPTYDEYIKERKKL